MKERIRCLLLTFIIALVFCVNVSATEQTGAQLYYVTDEAGLLSENENMMLEKMTETVSQKYGIGVYIETVLSSADTSEPAQRLSARSRLFSTLTSYLSARNPGRYAVENGFKSVLSYGSMESM